MFQQTSIVKAYVLYYFNFIGIIIVKRPRTIIWMECYINTILLLLLWFVMETIQALKLYTVYILSRCQNFYDEDVTSQVADIPSITSNTSCRNCFRGVRQQKI